jgi:glucose-6-phosphate 1-dehydrogenase
MPMSDRPIERLVIFGATGDLAARMLLPSLYFLDSEGLLPEALRIVGSARTEMTPEAYVDSVRADLAARAGAVDPLVWERFARRLDYRQADVSRP